VFTKIERYLEVTYTESSQEVWLDSVSEKAPIEEQKLPPEVAREVANRLREAAELGNISELTAVATELTERTDFPPRYSKEIARLAKDFDFEGLSHLAKTLVETATPGQEKA
jgi:hypothetical protein